MRTIHIRFADSENIDRKLVFENGEIKYLLRNLGGYQLNLLRPKLRRKVCEGVTIEDNWGSVEKWFDDHQASIRPLWSLK